jgi:hypothetical protein
MVPLSSLEKILRNKVSSENILAGTLFLTGNTRETYFIARISTGSLSSSD